MHQLPAIRRTVTAATALVAAAAALALPAAARAADYAVRLTGTSGSHWTSYGGTPFIIAPSRIASGKGTFGPGDYRSWRARVIGAGVRIVGGAVRIGVTTPNAPMRARIVVGTGSAPTVVHEEYGTGAVERPIPSGPNDWVQFDLSSTGAVTTAAANQDHVDLQWVDLVLRDTVPPALAAASLPPAGTWHGAGACAPFSIRLTDQGGGLLRAQVRRASDGLVVTATEAPQVQSTQPGPSEQELADCVQPGERGHGDTTFVATAWDVSGVSRELAFTVRADHRAPTIARGPVDGARITVARPVVAFDVADEGAGLASVTATLDGAAVPVTTGAGVATVQVGELARGAHVVSLAAVDGAGNATRTERRFTIADDAPPQLAVTSPGARGDATAQLAVRATDDMSGVDAASWKLLVDGAPVAFDATAETLTARLGPLASGSHRIDVSVRDAAGNLASASHAYYVVPPEPVAAQAPPPPGRSGAFLVDAPRGAVAFGRSATVAVHVVRNGDAVVGQRVAVRRDGGELAAAVTDADGVARVQVTAPGPGRYDAIADGMGFEPVELPIRVAPRAVIVASELRPRVRQPVRIAGRLYPALRGRVVSVEARVAGVWFPVRRTARTTVSGRFAVTVTAATPGPIHVRVKVKPTGAWSGAVSNAHLLRVRA